MENTPQLELTRLELLRQALKLAPLAALATLVNSIILVFVLWQTSSHRALIIWFSASSLFVLQRFIFFLRHRPASLRSDRVAQVTGWLIANLGLAGIIWGCVPIFLFPVNLPARQTLIVFVLCGMVAGSAETLASVLPAFFAFALAALVPLFFRFLMIGGAVYLAMAGMTVLYILLTSIIAIRINITNKKLINLKEHFATMADERAIINEQLKTEIAERGRIEGSLRSSEKQLKLLSSQLIMSQEEERKRIARELHDSIGSSLSAVKFSMENVICQMEKGAFDLEPVNYSIRAIRFAIDEVRSIVMDLRPALLDDHGIIATLNWFCKQFQSVYSDVCIENHIDIEENEIPEALKIILFRVAQEAFNNIAKYSAAKSVGISLAKEQGSIRLSIHDSGTGFDLDSIHLNKESGEGFGIISMRERIELSGGSFQITSEAGKGTRIQASWPLRC